METRNEMVTKLNELVDLVVEATKTADKKEILAQLHELKLYLQRQPGHQSLD